MKKGVIMLSHGSRMPEAQITVQKLKNLVQEIGNFETVEVASVQFNQPDLPGAIGDLYQRGIRSITIVPLFLYNGMHMTRDIPEILAAEKAKYPDLNISLTANIGAHRKLAEIVVERIGEAG